MHWVNVLWKKINKEFSAKIKGRYINPPFIQTPVLSGWIIWSYPGSWIICFALRSSFSRTYLDKSVFLPAALALVQVISCRRIDSLRHLMQIAFRFLSSKHGQGFVRFPLYLSFSWLYVFFRRFFRLSLGSTADSDDCWMTEGSELKPLMEDP